MLNNVGFQRLFPELWPWRTIERLACRVRELEIVNRRLATTLEEREHQNRQLHQITGHGAALQELERQGRLGGGAPYIFDELVGIARGEVRPPPSVPPMVFVHVPKAAGTTLNHIFMKNYRWRADSYGPHFFPRYYPGEFLSLVQPPRPDDTKRPVFFTGHIDLGNDIFRYMPVRYAAVTLLREPVARIISHYRFHSTLEASPLFTAIHAGKLDVVSYFTEQRHHIPLEFEAFGATADEAVTNLKTKISVFGLQKEFGTFLQALASLLGIHDLSHRPLNKTSESAPEIPAAQVEKLREVLAEDVEFYARASEIYRERAALVPSLETEHPWHQFYA